MQEDMASMLSVTDTETGEDKVVDGTAIQAVDTNPGYMENDMGPATGAEKSAISDLQTVADAFNAAFNSTLSELESSRREIEEGSARINELDEAARSIKSALDEEVEKGGRREEEYSRESVQLKQRIQDAESERDDLQGKVREQEQILEERSNEICELSSRIGNLNTTLEEHAEADARAREDFANEKRELTARLDELQGLYDGADSQLKKQQCELDKCNQEIGALREQVDSLLAEVASRENEAAHLDRQVTELQADIDTQTEALRMQSESHATTCEELTTRISGLSGELDTLRASYDDLNAHAENLERLNHVLHESSITEQKVYKQQLDEKAVELELLRSRIDSTGESLQDQPGSAAEVAELRKALRESEARFEEVKLQNQELSERADESVSLENLNGRLRSTLRRARERIKSTAGGSQEPESLQAEMEDLQSKLEVACSRNDELVEKLQRYEALGQEVTDLREALEKSNDAQADQENTCEAAEASGREVEYLRAALSASEENCRQLQAACSRTAEPDGSGAVLQVVPDKPQNAAAPGRERFISCLDELLTEQDGSERDHSLMYILLDNFISIRDEMGVIESEYMVREVGKIIESSCKADDVMARFGDCTFAVLCRNATVEQTEEVANEIRSAVESGIFEHENRSLVTTTSIGVCSIRMNDTVAKDIISRADLTCESARLSGGNKVIASSAIADEITIKGSHEDHKEMVRRTIEENRIRTYFQPISSLREESASHFEVLVRLVDQTGDMILPGEFFSMAEAAGNADSVDRFVIDNTMKMISESRGLQVKFFIKLTRQSVLDNDLPAWIMHKIDEYGISPEQLVFEVAEHIMQHNLKNLVSLSVSLNKIGCQIAIEHYRMSTSLQHLMHVHVDYLKIDKGLIGDVETKGENLAKIAAIMELAKKNNYITVAEGVETSGCLAMLWELGVSMAQGYFIQAPAAVREYVDNDIITDCSEDMSGKATYEVK